MLADAEAATPAQRKALFEALFQKLYVHEGKIKAVEAKPVLWTLLSTGIPVAGRTRTNPNYGVSQNPLNTFAL